MKASSLALRKSVTWKKSGELGFGFISIFLRRFDPKLMSAVRERGFFASKGLIGYISVCRVHHI